MQHSPDHLKARLLSCIDEQCNVTDMAGCLSVITILEQTPITRKILEDTRLGKYVNDIRRKTKDQELPKRLKNLVRKWRDTCQAESVNGLSSRGPGPGGGGGGGGEGSSSNGRQSISPPFSAPNSVKGHGGGLSPCSLPSSGNTSPMGRISAPTTPSTISYRSRTVSPIFAVAKGPLSATVLQAKSKVLSPRLGLPSPVISPQSNPGSAKPQSPLLSEAHLPPSSLNRITQESKQEPAYLPSVENVPKTNAANKRLRKANEDSDSELPPSKKSRNNLSNGFEEECSRDSFCSVLSNDRVSRASGDVGIASTGALENCLQKPIRRSGRRKKNAHDSLPGSISTTGLDPLRQKMAVIGAKSSKVKTTSQLVAELAERKGDALLARRASRLEERVKDRESEQSPLSRTDYDSVSQNKKEHMEKFLKSQPGPLLEEDDDDEVTILDDDDGDTEHTSTVPPSPSNPTPVREFLSFVPPSHPNSPPSNVDLLGITANETAEEILSRLPPLDLNAIEWEAPAKDDCKDPEIMSDSGSDCDENESSRLVRRSGKIESTVVQTLHSTNMDCMNGNFDTDGRFREWHEVIIQKAYQDSPLVVLPYVIADF